MKVLRIIAGIFGLLIAVFCGGCGLFFTNVYPPAVLIGGAPAVVGGLIAWWAFRRRPADEPQSTHEERPEL